jgi:hypothetical protein
MVEGLWPRDKRRPTFLISSGHVRLDVRALKTGIASIFLISLLQRKLIIALLSVGRKAQFFFSPPNQGLRIYENMKVLLAWQWG